MISVRVSVTYKQAGSAPMRGQHLVEEDLIHELVRRARRDREPRDDTILVNTGELRPAEVLYCVRLSSPADGIHVPLGFPSLC